MKVDYCIVSFRVVGFEKDVIELKMKYKEMDMFLLYVWKVFEFWEWVSKVKRNKDVWVESDVFYVGF